MDTEKTCYLFFDYDNTVRVNATVSEQTVSAMKHAQKMGHKLILCTGRARGSQIEDFEKIPWDAVINGGCDITYEDRCIEEKTVPEEEIRAWVEFSMQNRLLFIYEGQKEIIRCPFHEHAVAYTKEEIKAEQDRIATIAKSNPATKFSIMGTEFDTLPWPKTRMNPLIHPQYLEVFGEGCDKGRAIKRFCELLHLPLEQCACFGDSMNDYPMFLVCPVSVCMKRGPQALKKVASYVTKSNDGVAEGLEWLFMKGENQ